MTPEQIMAAAIAIAGPVSGFLIAVIANRRSKQQLDKEQSVAVATVTVSEKDAHTREIAVILDGYTKVNQALNSSLERVTKSSEECSEKYDALEKRFDEAERVNAVRRYELIDHIRRLEELVPSPPGPPERPKWS